MNAPTTSNSSMIEFTFIPYSLSHKHSGMSRQGLAVDCSGSGMNDGGFSRKRPVIYKRDNLKTVPGLCHTKLWRQIPPWAPAGEPTKIVDTHRGLHLEPVRSVVSRTGKDHRIVVVHVVDVPSTQRSNVHVELLVGIIQRRIQVISQRQIGVVASIMIGPTPLMSIGVVIAQDDFPFEHGALAAAKVVQTRVEVAFCHGVPSKIAPNSSRRLAHQVYKLFSLYLDAGRNEVPVVLEHV